MISNNVVANKKPFYWDEIQLLGKINEIIEVYNKKTYGNDKAKYIRFSAAYPDEVFDKTGTTTTLTNNDHHRLICYDIARKEDGSIGDSPFSSKTRPRPIVIESKEVTREYEDGKKDINILETYLKTYDILYRFDCLAPSDKESMDLVLLFEKMLEINAKYLEQGCNRFIYYGRRSSYFNRDTQYKSRTCEFFAQVQQLWYLEQDRINQINIEYLSNN